jgi:hypothetical protein
MRCLTDRLHRGFWVALLMFGGVAAADDATWKLVDAGPFTLRAPRSMVLTQGGTDSTAGSLAGEDVRLDYDFGPYSDPLRQGEDSSSYESRDGTVDGLPARFVNFTLPGKRAPARSCTGVHVSQVRRSALGWLRLTVLACADEPQDLKPARAILATLRFRRAAHD